jgi:hypothetical protein
MASYRSFFLVCKYDGKVYVHENLSKLQTAATLPTLQYIVNRPHKLAEWLRQLIYVDRPDLANSWRTRKELMEAFNYAPTVYTEDSKASVFSTMASLDPDRDGTTNMWIAAGCEGCVPPGSILFKSSNGRNIHYMVKTVQ